MLVSSKQATRPELSTDCRKEDISSLLYLNDDNVELPTLSRLCQQGGRLSGAVRLGRADIDIVPASVIGYCSNPGCLARLLITKCLLVAGISVVLDILKL